jgi:type IV secretion system protein VirB10
VSTNHPHQPSDHGDHANRPPDAARGGADNTQSDNNAYNRQYSQPASLDLDAAAPQLRTNEGRQTNRRMIAVTATMFTLLLITALLIANGITHRQPDEPVKPHKETVNVPPAPSPVPTNPAAQTTQLPQAIALAPKQTPALPSLLPVEPSKPSGPTLRERRMMTSDAAASPSGPNANAQTLAGIQGAATRAGSTAALADVSNAQPLNNPDTLMLRGTFIRCVLQTRVVTDYPGFTSCTVTEPVYSFNGKRLLLPKGSKVLGKYDTEPTTDRVYVVWDRIVTPTGIDVNMASPGVDNLGGSGHPGHYDAHWGNRIGAALLISLLSDAFKYEAAQHGPRQTTISNGVVTQTPFESNTAQTMQNLANQAVQRSANRAATVTINQGTVVSIYVAKDVDFSGVVARF